MRQTIGGTWLLQLMILFILLFVAYIILTLNYSKTVKMKNEVISMIEKYDGLNESSISLVNNFLESSNYTTTGVCTSEDTKGLYGAYSLQDTELEEAEPNKKYHYCVKKYKGTNLTNYYQVTLFYRFHLPVIGDTIRYMIKGTTSNFQAHDDLNLYGYTIGGALETNTPKPAPSATHYKVYFDYNDGSGNITNKTVEAGSTVTRPANPTRNGYIFSGWRLNDTDYNFGNKVTRNITLVARWTLNNVQNIVSEKVTVTYDLNGGTYRNDAFTDILTDYYHSNGKFVLGDAQYSSGKIVQKVNKGSRLSFKQTSPNFYRDGYEVYGWTLKGSTFSNGTVVNNDITLVAQWKRRGHYIVVDYNGGTYNRYGWGDDTYDISLGGSGYVSFNEYYEIMNDYGKKVKKPGYTFDYAAKIDGSRFYVGPGQNYFVGDIYVKLMWKKS